VAQAHVEDVWQVNKLRPYQVEGVEWLASKRTALLADEMRLGKSAQAVTAAWKIWPDDRQDIKIGVVCPASVVPVWHQQIVDWWRSPKLLPQYKVASYDKVTRGAFDGETFDVLILDEVHYLKSKDAQRTKKIFGPRCDGLGGLVSKAGKVIALSGTPAPNHPAEMWPMLRALAPETIHKGGAPMNYWSFVNTYCATKDNGFGLQITGGKNLQRLKEAITPFVLRRRYADVAADMPPLQFDTLPVNGIAPDDGELAALLKGCTTDDEILKRLQQKSTHVASLRRMVGLAKVKGVIEWHKNWLDSGGGKVVFFAHHKDVIEGLKTGLSTGTGNVVKLDGSMAQHERAASVRDFKEKEQCVAFIGQIHAAGTGIDLSTAHTTVFVESDWVPGNNLQAAMRIQKVGKTETNQVYMATLPGSIDEKIQGACLRKVRDSIEIFG
jgi:SWI/SNF-related matrix-associated actin-dependent regulator of chromatin subfamily A-like protein 1